jgi:twitching motility protein PilI
VDELHSSSNAGNIGIDAGMLLAAEVQGELQRRRRFGVRIGGAGFLIPSGMASEVVQQPRLFPLPWTVPYLRGLLNVRGNVVPVFDIRPLLQTNPATTSEPRYALILDSGSNIVGLLTDALPITIICDTADNSASNLLPSALAAHVTRSAVSGHEHWFELNHQSCLRALATRRD